MCTRLSADTEVDSRIHNTTLSDYNIQDGRKSGQSEASVCDSELTDSIRRTSVVLRLRRLLSLFLLLKL